MDARNEVRRLLDDLTTMTLAVADGEGPWAADVYFVRDGPDLFFFSSPRSRHAGALAADPRAAATVHAEATGWRDIRGVQLSGSVAEVAPGPERDRAVDLYLRKFPFARDLLLGAARLLDRVRFYRLSPDRVLLTDNSRGLGERTPVDWPA